MASGKRASMREGPLAALFRKTETEGLEDAAAAPRAAAQPRRRAPRSPRRRRARARAGAARRSRACRRRRSGCATRSPPTCPRT